MNSADLLLQAIVAVMASAAFGLLSGYKGTIKIFVSIELWFGVFSFCVSHFMRDSWCFATYGLGSGSLAFYFAREAAGLGEQPSS